MRKLLIALCIISASPSLSMSEVICSTQVSYRWGRSGDESEREVLWALVNQPGPDEEGAKERLTPRIELERTRAIEGCQQQHENLSGCIAVKMNKMASTLQAAGFTARKALEDAAISDCSTSQGKCLQATASEIKCVAKQVAATPEPTAAAGGDKKDKKEKKEKK